VNLLAHLALNAAAFQNASSVTAEHVKAAVDEAS
jgi:hypothetical protein